ncbi:hypothetical protein FRC01_013256 [Tulasnella sp. 417]|nr:hypothetical protein FRC01_013256 [Tulasnella sp. 417]
MVNNATIEFQNYSSLPLKLYSAPLQAGVWVKDAPPVDLLPQAVVVISAAYRPDGLDGTFKYTNDGGEIVIAFKSSPDKKNTVTITNSSSEVHAKDSFNPTGTLKLTLAFEDVGNK